MGCLCSKDSKNGGGRQGRSGGRGDDGIGPNRETEISNILHQSISLKNSMNVLTSVAELFLTNQYESFSLFHCPPADELLRRSWIYKRGHLVRTWKKRYCVIDKNDINYYVKSIPDPPFGKKLKGKVALLGAVCIDRESDDGKNIEVEIYGNVGEKDLFFSVNNNEEGQTFVRILHWAIRKSTLTILLRNLKTGNTGKSKDVEKYLCTQWKENQNLLFQASIQKLLAPQLFYILLTDPAGQIKVRPCVMKLWNIFGDSFVPTIQTESSHMGLAWHVVFPNDIEEYTGSGLPFLKEQQRIMSFEDIVDMTFQYVDETSNEWLRRNINHLHHHGNFISPSTGGGSSKKHRGPTEHPNSESNIYLIVTLWSKYDYKVSFLACCLHDYNDSLLAIQNILLYLNARMKLNHINHQELDEEEGGGGEGGGGGDGKNGSRNNTVSINTVSIKQSSAAQAFLLLRD